MALDDRFSQRRRHAERLIKEWGITKLPVDPFQIAADQNIVLMELPASQKGVSGMLIHHGNEFAIAYATHVDNDGFQRFSVAHELGHFFSPGHFEQLLGHTGQHSSHAGFVSDHPLELEADHFAAGLLMPRPLFQVVANSLQVEGLAAIQSMRESCRTSLTATAIQFAKYADTPVAVVLSIARQVQYCFISESLKELPGLDWPRKGSPLPATATLAFNLDPENVATGAQQEAVTSASEWFDSPWDIEMSEEIVGLGSYGRTLTVLSPVEAFDLEELQEEAELHESWTPKFRK